MKRDDTRNTDDLPDVRADDPEHAMERFNEGLRRVLDAKRVTKSKRVKPHRH